ncbi:megakaryocyte and platelet inhibitory receptor G6b isoform X1 [Molossus molossus]|uniref:Megakaryocyte and platelet inhibitory receptor G6b n=1 Tax=Molossus molossus TaxID=27622 RepID=A0A7J8GR83_MOLMO|nr:megakaryocyte and platelet inhibitory receptor G6b isoform X1 [Molossus molossus]KAF6462523.1 megakaryocyte and platelet inhibitory receptor G6b [Molossus molossus]
MALVLSLLPLLLSRAQGDPGVFLDGRPGDRVNLSCVGVSHPTRWAWAPSFPTCKGLSKGRRPILWASSSGTPTVPPVQPFAGRLRALDPGIRRLELLLSAGDSGTFICKGHHGNESRMVLHVLGDRAYCRAPGPSRESVYPPLLIPLLGAGLLLGLGVLGVVWWQRRRSSPHPHPLRPLPRFAPLVKAEPQRPVKEEEPHIAEDLDQESSLLYADLDHMALRRSCRLSPVASGDSSTIYAVVV